MEMVINGVSTRKVSNITEDLCGVSFLKSTMSQLCTGLDARVRAFNELRFDGDSYPFIIVDAMFIKCPDGDRVACRVALIISGIRNDGYREILGLRIVGPEIYTTWDEAFK